MPKVQRYISTELTHFVGRGKAQEDQYALLVHILQLGWLTHPPHNPNISGNLSITSGASISANQMYSPEVVCFCDIPTEDLQIHTAKYSSFGLSLPKDLVARQGGAPVFYLPLNTRARASRGLSTPQLMAAISEGKIEDVYGEIPLGQLFDRMVPEYHAMMDLFRNLIMQTRETPGVPEEHRRLHDLLHFLDFRLLSYVKFFDHSLADDDPSNFYMEREWRVVGNVQFTLSDVTRVLVPPSYGSRLRLDVPEFAGQVTFVE
jgi:hypothetical protein